MKKLKEEKFILLTIQFIYMFNDKAFDLLEKLGLPISIFQPLIVDKLAVQSEFFNVMDENGGRIPYPEIMLEYFQKLGVEHWAEYYFQEKLREKEQDIEDFKLSIKNDLLEHLGESFNIEQLSKYSAQLFGDLANKLHHNEYFQFLSQYPDPSALDKIDAEDRELKRDVCIAFLVKFYDDLSLATHGESIFSLINKAISKNDDHSLGKAIQIDPTILYYVQRKMSTRHLQGDSNFFDLISYRFKNPPRRGVVKHPLLWILLRDLFHFGCLRKSITNKQILDLYNEGVKNQPKYLIDDEQIVQRQRRKFLQKYRL